MRRQSPNVCKQLLGSLPAEIKEADNGAKDKQEIKTKPSGNAHGGCKIGFRENRGKYGGIYEFRYALGTGQRQHIYGNINRSL